MPLGFSGCFLGRIDLCHGLADLGCIKLFLFHLQDACVASIKETSTLLHTAGEDLSAEIEVSSHMICQSFQCFGLLCCLTSLCRCVISRLGCLVRHLSSSARWLSLQGIAAKSCPTHSLHLPLMQTNAGTYGTLLLFSMC